MEAIVITELGKVLARAIVELQDDLDLVHLVHLQNNWKLLDSLTVDPFLQLLI